MLSGYEETSVAAVEAVLDANPASAEDVYLATVGHSERSVAAVAAYRVQALFAVDGEPDDSTLVAGEWVFWLDESLGSPKLRVKAKIQDDSIVTGSVNLS
jgi:hypothetical protein